METQEKGWPEDALESCPLCPVCGSRARTRLHEDLRDRLFGAPGSWLLWKCQACGCGWLDPRPDPASIGRAYSGYLTHSISEGAIELARPGFLHGLKLRAAHAILNHELGHQLKPALPLAAAQRILPRARQIQILNKVRHLPAPGRNPPRLLDIGSGNGAFLLIARKLGYEATGLEPDPRAASLARAHGATVYTGTLPHPSLPREHYDHLTLAHVIEHLHDPLAILRECADLLRPGGRLWVQTPNLEAAGHAYWGRDWRGLEPPRHLVLFTRESLERLLGSAGFHGIRLLTSPLESRDMFRHSLAIRLGTDLRVNHKPRLDRAARRAVRRALAGRADPGVAEAITVVAWK